MCFSSFYSLCLSFFEISGTQRRTAELSGYVEHDQWELIRPVTFDIKEKMYGKVSFSEFQATIRLRRRSLFYQFVLIGPNMLIYLLSTFVFFLPVESGEKVSYIVTILLAEVVTVGTLSDIFPASSLGFPILAYFVTALTVHLSLLCLATVSGTYFCHQLLQI